MFGSNHSLNDELLLLGLDSRVRVLVSDGCGRKSPKTLEGLSPAGAVADLGAGRDEDGGQMGSNHGGRNENRSELQKHKRWSNCNGSVSQNPEKETRESLSFCCNESIVQ